MTTTSVQRVARLLTLVPWLQRNDGVTLTEAAGHFGLTRDELERDLWQVILCGFPGYGPDQLVDIDFWDNDRIHVIDPLALSMPLRLTSQEALSILAGLSILKDTPGVGEIDLILRTIRELESAIAHNETFTWESSVDPQVRTTVDEALRTSSAVRFTYRGITTDTVTERVVVPESIDVRHGHVYLLGWCVDANDQRIFRMDRVVNPTVESITTVPGTPRERDVQEAVISGQNSAAWLLDRLSVVEMLPSSEGWTARVSYADPRWLTREIMGAGGMAWVVAPVETRDLVRRAAEMLLARYAEPPKTK